MAQPVWITPAGSLGTIPQGIFLEPIQLQVSEEDGSQVYYKVIAGALPTGIECTKDGYLTGVPTNEVTVAQETVVGDNFDITSKFAIRAYTTRTISGVTVINRLADRTFTMTVAGQNSPRWITPPGPLNSSSSTGMFMIGTLLSPGLQLEYVNNNPDNIPPSVTLIAGALPPGITLSSLGLLSGYFEVNPALGAQPGFSVDGQTYDEYPFDYSVDPVSYTYEFTLQVTDGRTSDIRTFSMYVETPTNFNTSTTVITSDNEILTVDVSTYVTPVLLNTQGSIGSATADSFFAYQFIGASIFDDTVGYIGYNLPPGLELDVLSGWLYGYLPDIGLTEREYEFTVKVFQYGNQASTLSTPYTYTLTIQGPISGQVTWITSSNLGTIANGGTSDFYVEAVSTANLTLQYRLLSGSNSKLPQGLTLLPSGNIVGRVSFNTFAIDEGETTFDVESGKPTTFDLTYTFTVNAYSVNGYVSVNQTFTITIDRLYAVPYNNLYIQCMPPQDNRQLISSLIQNSSIFPSNLLYRPDDPNFGLSKTVTYYHAYGLYAEAIPTYLAALQFNHYWKNLTLGPIETAQALDPVTGKVVYEVVYSKIIDNLVNNEGVPADKNVVLPYPVPRTPKNISVVYPNALLDMQTQVIDIVGQESKMLPTWMLSKQTDGSVLGFTPAWVIAYTKPGTSGQIAYNIQSQFGTQLNLVDFTVDRYVMDNSMTTNWNSNTQQWDPTPSEATTFDVDPHYTLTINTGGAGYTIGDRLVIPGTSIGGTSPENDVVIYVDTVDSSGSIVNAFYAGNAPFLIQGQVFNNVLSTDTSAGVGASWNVTAVPGEPTIFDGGSLNFTVPADMNTNTNAYDKYLMFPRINILSPVDPYYVVWKNTAKLTENWINNSNIAIPWASSNA